MGLAEEYETVRIEEVKDRLTLDNKDRRTEGQINRYKFRLFGVIRSYQKLRGFQPVELRDVCAFNNSNVL